MANPQAENGHTDIAHEIVEALARTRVPGEATQVLWVILRKTYGYHKKKDWISLSQFVGMTGIKKPHIIRALNKLIAMKIVAKKGNGKDVIYSFQKDYEKWVPLPKKVTLPKKVMPITQKGNSPLPKKVHTKENITKEDTTKENTDLTRKTHSPKKPPNPDHKKAIEYWMTSYESHIGIKYNFTDKDGKIISRLLKTYGLDNLKAIMDQIFNTEDEFIRKRGGRTLGVLSACANKLAQEVFARKTPLDGLSEAGRKTYLNAQQALKELGEEKNAK